jgi:hypothetical protein
MFSVVSTLGVAHGLRDDLAWHAFVVRRRGIHGAERQPRRPFQQQRVAGRENPAPRVVGKISDVDAMLRSRSARRPRCASGRMTRFKREAQTSPPQTRRLWACMTSDSQTVRTGFDAGVRILVRRRRRISCSRHRLCEREASPLRRRSRRDGFRAWARRNNSQALFHARSNPVPLFDGNRR